MNIISLILVALSITVGVLVTTINNNENTADCVETTKNQSEALTEPFTETEKAETASIKQIIIL